MTILPAIILLVILLIGLQALLAGFRGRRIDDHPLCRRCGFDLTGRPETSTACSECGADLSQPHAIVIGHRRRRPRLIVVGALVMAFAIVSIGSMALRVDFQVYKPTWWVIHEAADKSPSAPIAAWTELNRRLKAGELSRSQVDRVAALALAIQGDKNRTWNALYGDF